MIDAALFALLAVTVAAAVARTLRPSELADRIIGLDVAILGFLGLLALAAVVGDEPWLLDALPVLGLLAVVATVTFSRAVGRRR